MLQYMTKERCIESYTRLLAQYPRKPSLGRRNLRYSSVRHISSIYTTALAECKGDEIAIRHIPAEASGRLLGYSGD